MGEVDSFQLPMSSERSCGVFRSLRRLVSVADNPSERFLTRDQSSDTENFPLVPTLAVRPFRNLLLIGLLLSGRELRETPNTGPWDLELLRKPPQATLVEPEAPITGVYYPGEPYRGKPTRVFGWLARPQSPGKHPAMVLVHGGGGTAFREWAELWANRGYVALAMDLAGHGPDQKPLAERFYANAVGPLAYRSSTGSDRGRDPPNLHGAIAAMRAIAAWERRVRFRRCCSPTSCSIRGNDRDPRSYPAILFGVVYLAYSAWADARGAHGNVNHSAHFWGAAFGIAFALVVEPRLSRDLRRPPARAPGVIKHSR